MKTTKHALITLIGLLLTLSVFAQQPTAQLSKADVDLFIKSFKPLQKDLEALGDKYEKMDTENMNMATASSMGWMVNEQVANVFKKHGWNEGYMQKYVAIVTAFTYLKMETELQKMPAEQKQYAEQMITAYKMQIAQTVHENDIDAVRGRLSEVETVLTEDN